MRFAKTGFIIIVSLLLGGLSAWLLRGEYDKHFMMEGNFHVVSCADREHMVSLAFPSGQKKNFNLKKGGFADFKLLGTGEGSITVSIDGKPRDRVGYVPINGIVILVIDEERTVFSQIFPSLKTEKQAE